jgi:hypothetical protein
MVLIPPKEYCSGIVKYRLWLLWVRKPFFQPQQPQLPQQDSAQLPQVKNEHTRCIREKHSSSCVYPWLPAPTSCFASLPNTITVTFLNFSFLNSFFMIVLLQVKKSISTLLQRVFQFKFLITLYFLHFYILHSNTTLKPVRIILIGNNSLLTTKRDIFFINGNGRFSYLPGI